MASGAMWTCWKKCYALARLFCADVSYSFSPDEIASLHESGSAELFYPGKRRASIADVEQAYWLARRVARQKAEAARREAVARVKALEEIRLDEEAKRKRRLAFEKKVRSRVVQRSNQHTPGIDLRKEGGCAKGS